jgi:hypothetical protein
LDRSETGEIAGGTLDVASESAHGPAAGNQGAGGFAADASGGSDDEGDAVHGFLPFVSVVGTRDHGQHAPAGG